MGPSPLRYDLKKVHQIFLFLVHREDQATTDGDI